MAELLEALKVVRELSQYVPLAIVIFTYFIMRDIRRFMAATKNGIIRNCVHHRLMFDKLGVGNAEVVEAETAAGLKIGKESDLP